MKRSYQPGRNRRHPQQAGIGGRMRGLWVPAINEVSYPSAELTMTGVVVGNVLSPFKQATVGPRCSSFGLDQVVFQKNTDNSLNYPLSITQGANEHEFVIKFGIGVLDPGGVLKIGLLAPSWWLSEGQCSGLFAAVKANG